MVWRAPRGGHHWGDALGPSVITIGGRPAKSTLGGPPLGRRTWTLCTIGGRPAKSTMRGPPLGRRAFMGGRPTTHGTEDASRGPPLGRGTWTLRTMGCRPTAHGTESIERATAGEMHLSMPSLVVLPPMVRRAPREGHRWGGALGPSRGPPLGRGTWTVRRGPALGRRTWTLEATAPIPTPRDLRPPSRTHLKIEEGR